MRYCISSKDMKYIDDYTISVGMTDPLILMERAAQAFCDELIRDCLELRDIQFVSVCGKGNNGADGIAIARILKKQGLDVKAILAGVDYDMSTGIRYDLEGVTRQWICQFREAQKYQLEMMGYESGILEQLCVDTDKKITVLIDGLVGIGLSRPLVGQLETIVNEITGLKRRAIENYKKEINIENVFVYSIDMMSGAGFEPYIYADKVVTFGNEKLELLVYPGQKALRRGPISNYYINIDNNLVVKNIGFLKAAYNDVDTIKILEESDIKLLPERDLYGNKGTFGKVFIIGGSRGMCGAAVFCGRAALRTGAGMVKILSSEENCNIYQNLLPEAVLSVYNDGNYKELLVKNIKEAKAVVLGPGLGKSQFSKELVRIGMAIAREYHKTIIIDGDGLGIIAEEPGLTDYYTDRTIITPHIGEMSRLTGQNIEYIKKNIVEVAKAYGKRYGITVALKDARAIISDGDDTYINIYGNHGMAKAGSGDILAGIIAGIIAVYSKDKNNKMTYMTAIGLMVHGLAGEKAATNKRASSIIASDIIEALGMVSLP